MTFRGSPVYGYKRENPFYYRARVEVIHLVQSEFPHERCGLA